MTASRLLNLPNTPALISDPVIYQEINEIYKALKLIAEELENSDDDTAATLAEILQRLKRTETATVEAAVSGEYYMVCQTTPDAGTALAAWNTEYAEVAILPLNTGMGAIENVRFAASGVGVINSGGDFYFVVFDGSHLTLSAEYATHVAAEAADISVDGQYMYVEDTNIEVYKRYYNQGAQLLQAVQTVIAQGNGGGIKVSHSGEYLIHQQNISGTYYATIWEILSTGWLDDSAYIARVSTAGLAGPYAFAWNSADTLIACITTQATTDIQVFSFDSVAPSLTALSFSGPDVVTDGSMYNNMLCWHPTLDYLIVGSAYFDPQLSLYSVVGSTVTDLTLNIDMQPSATIRSVDWSADGTRVYVNASSEFVKIYEFDSDLETLTYLFTRPLYAAGTTGTLVNINLGDVTSAVQDEIPV